MQQINMK